MVVEVLLQLRTCKFLSCIFVALLVSRLEFVIVVPLDVNLAYRSIISVCFCLFCGSMDVLYSF
jgi:hypothetical protein